MSKGRPEGFSDGVLAIVITIMVLEPHAPEGTTFEDLFALWIVPAPSIEGQLSESQSH